LNITNFNDFIQKQSELLQYVHSVISEVLNDKLK